MIRATPSVAEAIGTQSVKVLLVRMCLCLVGTHQSMFSGSAGWLVGWLVGLSVGWSVGWSVGQLVSWSVGQLVRWSIGQLVSWSVGQLVSWSVDQLVSCLVGQMVSWSDGQMVSWSVGLLHLLGWYILGYVQLQKYVCVLWFLHVKSEGMCVFDLLDTSQCLVVRKCLCSCFNIFN